MPYAFRHARKVAVKKLVIAVTPLLFLSAVVFLLWTRNPKILDILGAFLPSLGLIVYIVLDHLWTEQQTDQTNWLRWMRALAYWNWKWRGANMLTRKAQLALCLIILTLISGTVQYIKAREDNDTTHFTKGELLHTHQQLDSANAQIQAGNAIASQSLANASHSLTNTAIALSDIDILETYLESSTLWQQKIYLKIGTNCPISTPLLVALAEEPQPALVITNGSASLKRFAARWTEEKQNEKTQKAAKESDGPLPVPCSG